MSLCIDYDGVGRATQRGEDLSHPEAVVQTVQIWLQGFISGAISIPRLLGFTRAHGTLVHLSVRSFVVTITVLIPFFGLHLRMLSV